MLHFFASAAMFAASFSPNTAALPVPAESAHYISSKEELAPKPELKIVIVIHDNGSVTGHAYNDGKDCVTVEIAMGTELFGTLSNCP